MACFSPAALRARWPAVMSSARSACARASGIQLMLGSTVVSAWLSLIPIAPAYPASPVLSSLGVAGCEERPNEVRHGRRCADVGGVVVQAGGAGVRRSGDQLRQFRLHRAQPLRAPVAC